LWQCNRTGHLIDPDFPIDQNVIKNNTSGRFHLYTLGRCLKCGGVYSIKQEVPEPSGIVDPAGRPAPLVQP
jgi:hypothetical protein